MRASKLPWYAFALLTLTALLNLNGAVYMLLGIAQVGSPLLIIAILLLLYRAPMPAACLSKPGLAFVAGIALYLLIGAAYSLSSASPRVFGYLGTYIGSMLVIYASASYVAQLRDRDANLAAIGLIAWGSFIAACAVFFSDFLFAVYRNPPLATERYAGIFANANEAGIMCLVCFVFMLWLHNEQRQLRYLAAAAVCAVAVFFTLSKSSITGLFILLLINSVWRLRPGNALVIALFAALAWGFLANPELWSDGLADSQLRRLEQSLQILSGQIDADTTSGRTQLWSYGLALARENLLISGAGLGSFHHLQGGIFENGVWQGVHNTYLMMTGEAGLPVALVFGAANLMLLFALWRAGLKYLFMYAVILQIDFAAAHNVLGLRFHNVLIGFMFGVLAQTSQLAVHAPVRRLLRPAPS